ncbi:MAG: TolC family protein, partial [Desulfurobacteriaceae bacterium]
KDKEVKVSLNEVKNEKSKYGLKVKLDAVYTRNYGFESRENEEYGFISLAVQYPIFSFGRKKYDILSTKLKKLSKEKEFETEKLNLKEKLSNAISDLVSIQSKIELSREKLSLAKEIERIEKLKYETGKGDIDHYLLAKAKRFLAEAELNSYYYKWEIAKRTIKALVEDEL